MIKKELSLLNGAENVFQFPQSTINSFMVEDEEKDVYLSSVKIFMNRMKNHSTAPYVQFHIDTNFKFVDIIRMKQYPLPAVFNATSKHCVINISALQKRSISNIDMRDLYTILVYGHSCLILSLTKNKFILNYPDVICQYMGFVYLKLFAKRYGITGSYIDKIPQFRFIVYAYIYRNFFGFSQKESFRQASVLSRYDISESDVNLNNYDISIFKEFLKLLSDSEVTPGLTEYRFLEQNIRSFGAMNLPFFEDLMRFCSIILASTVSGNSYFSAAFQLFNQSYFSKVVDIITSALNKEM